MTTTFSGQPFTVHQFHYRASAGDLITQHMLFLQEALCEIGISGKIFSVEKNNLPQGKVDNWLLEAAWNCDLFLIHHSQGNPVLAQLAELEVPSALIYHSTAPDTFYSHDPEVKNRVQLGKKQLKFFKKQAFPAYCTSNVVVKELSQLGFDNPALLPLFHLPPTPPLEELAQGDESKNILYVGRLAPHKRQAQLIETFYHLAPQLPAQSKLFLVGTGDPLYTKYLRLLIAQLGLSDSVVLTGKVTQGDLQHYYSLADAFVGLSAYEGFCLSFVEAMRHGIPVFYWGVPGAKETMGKSGIELLTDQPLEIAAIMSGFLNQPSALKAIVRNQLQRLTEIFQTQNKQLAQRILLNHCSSLRRKSSIRNSTGDFHEPLITL